MIELSLSGNNYELDEDIKEYAHKKIGNLDRFLPRQMRGGLHATVTLIDDTSGRENNEFVCEVVLPVPGSTLMAKEGTGNIYAAIDVVEAKLKSQIATIKHKQQAKRYTPRSLANKILRNKLATDATIDNQPSEA